MRYAAFAVLLAAVPAALAAQGTPAAPPSAADPHGGAVLGAVRTTGQVRVDGRLDDAAWSAATPATSFTQLDPAEGQPVSERTEVRVLYDDEALYVGVRLHDAGAVTTRLGRRDMSMEASDWLTVILDSYHDHRTAFGFELNPSGVRRDQTRSEETGEDDSWDPVWVGETSVDSGGWTAEMRIPFSQIRFNTAAQQTWGIQVERQIARKGEFSVFAFTPRSQPGGIPAFGHLTGLTDVRTGKRLEVLPYTLMKAEHVERGDNPFRDDREYTPDFGADLKYRLTSDLTLDATINPDFGQVEVDPAEVNLSTIETRFQERRPFFVEGADIFNFGTGGGNSAFYSRRIGRAPQVPANYSVADVPVETRILGAAKVSGRTRTGWSVGLLNAVTGREEARFLDVAEGDSLRGRQTVEPLSNYFVSRVRRDMRQGQTVVGGMFTAVNRNLDDDLLRSRLHSSAYNGGMDFRHQWNNRLWQLRGFVSGSHIRGDRRAIARTQLLQSYHYFQRPDQDEILFDSTRTSLSGASTEIQLSYRPGRNWRPALLVGTTTPGYDVNDMGFQYRANRADLQGTLAYVENRPGKTFRNYQLDGYARNEWNYDGEHIYNNYQLHGYGQFLNFWFGEFTAGTTLAGTVDDKLTRGGPLARRPGAWRVMGAVGSDERKAVAGYLQSQYTRDDEGGSDLLMLAELQLKPSPRWNLSLTPVYQRTQIGAQYITSRADAAAVNTYGRRYVLSELDQATLSLETRLNVTFTTDLSLQLYAQPLLASADYGTPSELARPRTYDFDVYGQDVGDLESTDGGYLVYPQGAGEGQPSFFVPDLDFNLRSLRGNAVLRWEWRPGSTLYLAWQQERSDYAPYVGDFQMGRDRRALFNAQPDNVLVLKVSYWLNP